MGRAERITSAIKRHDYNLFCKQVEGKLHVFRRAKRVESFVLDGGEVLHFVRPSSDYVMSLTKDWQLRGESADWGIDPILKRLQDIDLWNRDIVSDLEKQDEKTRAEADAKRRRETEDFLYEFRDDFKKTFSDVNVANMDKNKKTRRF